MGNILRKSACNCRALTNRSCSTLHVIDNTYRYLLGNKYWGKIKPEIRKRFSVKPTEDGCICYAGKMDAVRLNVMGWLFAQVCRVIGTPLAPLTGENVPMQIQLSKNMNINGVDWKRIYYFKNNNEVTVRSTKSLNNLGQLEEHIGCGFSMALKVFEMEGNLIFESTDYIFRVGKILLRLPAIITPGVTTVLHEQMYQDHFRFTLSVKHPWFGQTIYQSGVFYNA